LRPAGPRDKISDRKMNKKNILRLGLIGVLTAVFLWFFLRSIKNWNEVLRYLANIDWRWAVPAILLTPVHLFTRGFRWKYLLHHEKKDIRIYSLWTGNAVGFTVTYVFPGRLGELIKPLYVARKEGMRPGFVIGTAVVERIFDIFTMCFLLGFFLLTRPLLAPRLNLQAEGYSNLYLWGGIGIVFATVLLTTILLFYFFKEKALAIASKVLKILPHRFRDKALRLLHEFIDGLRIFHNLGDFVVYILLGFVVWLSIIFYYWLFFFAFRFPVPFFYLFPYIFLTAVGASIPTPGMVGGYHWFSQLGLVTLLGMDPNMAGGFTIVVHVVQLVVTCLIGYTVLWKEGLSMFQLKKLGEDPRP
jgi:uncharacterized protein (TIRG00374 family)